MPTSWRKNFTQIDNVNNGNEFELNDYPLLDGFNVPLNNTQWLYDEIQKNEKVILGTLSSSNVLTITNYNSLASADRDKLKNWKILITKDVSGVQDCLSVFNFVEMQLTNNGEYNSIEYVFQNEFDERITIDYDESDNSYSSSYEQARLRLYRHDIILHYRVTATSPYTEYYIYFSITNKRSASYDSNTLNDLISEIPNYMSCSGYRSYNGETNIFAVRGNVNNILVQTVSGTTGLSAFQLVSITDDNPKEITL